jgi:alkanesulfonate monooxygenase SsuD/methylene tetrahydromethanopterin reductase-like flavin-dependent oxidoreductase (luciferase family)
MRMSIISVQDHYPARARSEAELYRQVVAEAELADELGYDTFFVAEHHFHEYGIVPNPAVLLAAIAQRTRRIRLGTAISTLTYHNPIEVAESYAMLDILSDGRLTLGVGSGYLSHEFDGFGIDPAVKRERFDETFGLVRRLLAGETVTHKGRFHDLKGVRINVAPRQADIPLYVAILRAEAAYHVGRQGFSLFTIPYASVDAFEQIADLVASHRRGFAEAGRTDTANTLAIAFHTHVAETDAAARRVAAAPFDLYVATRLYARKSTYDDAMANGLSLMGSVETVASKLVALAEMGVDHVMAFHNFGAMPASEVTRSMRLLMAEVMPRVEKRIAATSAA